MTNKKNRILLIFFIFVMSACDTFKSEIEPLKDGTFRLRVKAEDDGSGAQVMQAFHEAGTAACNGPFEPVSAAELDAGFPFFKYPAMVVDIKCGPSDYPDRILETE